ncbi:MAG: hypothetical protein ACE5FW_02965 [Candidatus Aenigmatarchaeota archaeon]
MSKVKESFGEVAIRHLIERFRSDPDDTRALPALKKITGMDFATPHHWRQWFEDRVSNRVSFKEYSFRAAQVVLEQEVMMLFVDAVYYLEERGGAEAIVALYAFLMRGVPWRDSALEALVAVMQKCPKEELKKAIKRLRQSANFTPVLP